jgi:hypothetical protein
VYTFVLLEKKKKILSDRVGRIGMAPTSDQNPLKDSSESTETQKL